MIVGRRITDGAGYLFNDNRASGQGVEEADVLTCSHCQKVLLAHNWHQDGGFCGSCGQAVCGPCADKILLPLDQGGGCTPFIKLVEQQMEEQYRRQQNRKVFGI